MEFHAPLYWQKAAIEGNFIGKSRSMGGDRCYTDRKKKTMGYITY